MGRDDPLRLRDLLARMELVFVCIHLLFWKANKLEKNERKKKQDGKECCYKYGHRAYSFRVISGVLFLLYNNIVNIIISIFHNNKSKVINQKSKGKIKIKNQIKI